MKNEDKLNVLKTILEFSDEDLQSNQNGKLSYKQRRLIKKNAITSTISFFAAGLAISVLFLLVAKRPLSVNTVEISATIFSLFVLIGLILFFIQYRDYRNGKVKSHIGELNIVPNRYSYFLVIGQVKLPLIYDLRGLIEESTIYKVYYTPNEKKILSLEKVQWHKTNDLPINVVSAKGEGQN